MHDDSLARLHRLDGIRAAPPGQHAEADWRPLLALLAYCLAYLAIRMAVGGALERDEAEIVYFTQQLKLGYGTQPPLYAWLQWLVFDLFGINRLSLLVLKTLALGATCVCMYQAARPLIGREGALAVSASLALFPQVFWEALRIQTHSVLMTAIAAATLWLYFALLRKPSLGRYAGFGLLCGLGLQTKYNYGVFLAALAGASLLVPAHRAILWNRRILAALLPAVLLLLPHASWVAQNPGLAFGGTLRKMQDGAAHASYLARVGEGTLRVLSGIASFVALPASVYAVVCWRRRRLWRGRPMLHLAAYGRNVAPARFFTCFYGICLLLLAVLALTGEVATIKERWMIPLLFSLPLGLFVLFPALRRQEIFADIRHSAVFVALGLLALLPLRLWLGPAFGKEMTQHHPYAQLARAVERQCPAARTVVTESLLTAGNLRFARPRLRTLLLEDERRAPQALDGPAVLVTHAHAAPAALAEFHALYPAVKPGPPAELGLALEDGSGRQFGFMIACL
jgi:4-amino-4-deoxy-L-arabinose transferase-like glycosyltransferase